MNEGKNENVESNGVEKQQHNAIKMLNQPSPSRSLSVVSELK